MPLSPPDGHKSSLSRHVRTALKLVVSIGLLVLLLSKAGLPEIARVLWHADSRWVAAALALGFVATGIQATQWQALLAASGLARRWLRCLRLVFVGSVFNTILPSSVGGDVVRAVVVAEQPAERIPAAATVILQRLCNFPGMLALLGLGLLLSLGEPEATRIRPLAAVGLLLGIAGLWVAMSPLLGWTASREILQRAPFGRALTKLLQTLDAFRGRRGTLVAASARGLAFWSLVVLSQWSFMQALGIHAGLAYAAVVVTTVNGLTMLPISINGYGVREGGFVAFLAVSGLATTAQAVGVGLSLAAQTLLWALIGLACWVSLPRSEIRAARPVLAEKTA